MLTEKQIRQIWQHLSLSEKALMLVKSIRSSDLSLRARIGKGNVSGCYPSRKMASSILFESRRIELPFSYQIEHDGNILE